MTTRLPRPVLIPLIVACALFMENLDSTVIATALPVIADAFGESPLRLSLAITSYLLSLAVFIPLSGWMADRFGTRGVFRGAILVFTLGSILCGLSGSMLELVGARILQGLGGAMMVPVGRLVLLRAIPKDRLVQAMAYLTVPALMGPVLGPLVGGFIATYGSWRWIFFVNVPIGLLGIALVTTFIDDAREAKPPPFDLPGFLLAAAGLAALVLGFETIGRDMLPMPAVLGLLAGGTVLLLLYLRHARRTAHPILDLSLLRVRSFGASIFGGTLFRIGIGALPLLLPMMLQLGFGLSPLESGLLTFASALGAMAMKPTSAPILRRFGFRTVLVGNAVIGGLFLAAYGLFRPDTPHLVILAALLAGGFFRSLQFTAINTLGYADLPSERLSHASSLSSTAQQVSLSLGVATGAVLVNGAMAWRGGAELSAADFPPAFLAIGLIALSSALVFRLLPPDAGTSVSGHRRPAVEATQPAE